MSQVQVSQGTSQALLPSDVPELEDEELEVHVPEKIGELMRALSTAVPLSLEQPELLASECLLVQRLSNKGE